MSEQRTNILLNNRRTFTARQSMEALVNFARYPSPYLREQDEKIYTRRKRFAYGKGITVFALSIIPAVYLAYVIYKLLSLSLLDIGEISITQASSPLPSKQSKATSESTLFLSSTSRKERSERSSLDSRTPSNFEHCSKNQHQLDQYLKQIIIITQLLNFSCP